MGRHPRGPGEEGHATSGASTQRQNRDEDTGHREKIDSIREGKQDVISENTPEPRPGYGREDD